MSFFKHIEGEAAVVVTNGVYQQVDLYERDGFLYAKIGSGFVRLSQDGSTTKAKTRLDFMSWTGPLYRDSLGRLAAREIAGLKTCKLDEPVERKLLGLSS